MTYTCEDELAGAAAKLLRSLGADARPAVLDRLVDGFVDSLVMMRPDLSADELASRALQYRDEVKRRVGSA